MRGAMLFAAGLVTGLAVSAGVAQNANTGVSMMNHVGINVPNIQDAVKYYTDKMGYREAFRINEDDGTTRLVYLYISGNTFLELQQAGPNRPAGFTHYGLVVDKAAAAVASFRGRGATVTDVIEGTGGGVNRAYIADPYMGMGQVELVEITPGSPHAKAIANGL